MAKHRQSPLAKREEQQRLLKEATRESTPTSALIDEVLARVQSFAGKTELDVFKRACGDDENGLDQYRRGDDAVVRAYCIKLLGRQDAYDAERQLELFQQQFRKPGTL